MAVLYVESGSVFLILHLDDINNFFEGKEVFDNCFSVRKGYNRKKFKMY